MQDLDHQKDREGVWSFGGVGRIMLIMNTLDSKKKGEGMVNEFENHNGT